MHFHSQTSPKNHVANIYATSRRGMLEEVGGIANEHKKQSGVNSRAITAAMNIFVYCILIAACQ